MQQRLQPCVLWLQPYRTCQVRTGLVLADTFSGASDEFGSVRACIGVGSGRAFAGVVGASGAGLDRREFTTMGDCVNVAARMMGLASKPGAARQVIMDEDTKDSVKDLVFFEKVCVQTLDSRLYTHCTYYAPASRRSILILLTMLATLTILRVQS